ncbi:MAG: presqualene diphosphate synthase HpnD [Rickettsiales bacterium]|nr:presqualene diphosphate synthase HpnD [Rickettsiales bacterium]
MPTAHAIPSALMKEAPTANAGASARGSSFFIAMRIMPPAQRAAMFEIYHFCRAVDDIADEAGDVAIRLNQLQQWRDEIAAIYHQEPVPHRQGLAQAIEKFDLLQEDFLAVIDGMEMDVRGPVQAPDMATLEQYCDRVACAVGRLSVRVFGMETSDGLQLSHHLGNALQLTNILRDIDEDAAIDRLYLPRELLLEAGIDAVDPKKVITHPAISHVCMTLATTAADHFQSANRIMDRYSPTIVRTPRMMSEAYGAIYAALMQRGFAFPRRRARLSKLRLAMIVLRHVII